MTRVARVCTSLAVGAVLGPYVPLYVARSMTRSFGEGGDRITHAWQLHSLPGFLAAMTYMRPEEEPQRMLAINVGLAVVYAGALALLTYFVLTRARSPR